MRARSVLLLLLLALATLALADARPAAANALTGVLVQRHGDRLDGTSTAAHYVLAAPQGRVQLASPQNPDLVGRLVTIADRDLARPGVQGTATPAQGPAHRVPGVAPLARPAAGPRSTLVVLVALSESAQPFTPDEARQAVFSGPESASLLYAEQSHGASWLTGIRQPEGDVTGPVLVGTSGAGCPYDAIADAADAAIAQQGWSPSSYAHVLYVLPPLQDCDWAGLGEMPGRRAWSNGYLATSVIAHELGHGRGVHHASSLRCVGPSGEAVTLSDSCTPSEYGDPFDVMGLGAHLMSAFHRAQVGDLPADARLLVTHAGAYPLGRTDDSTGTRLLLVPRKAPGQPVTEYYALEHRSALWPFDAFDVLDPVLGGVSVRLVPRLDASVQTRLLDMHPSTASLLDAPLQPSETFSDPDRPISLTVDPQGDGVVVAMPPFVDDVPPTFAEKPWLETDVDQATLEWEAAVDDVAVDRYEIERDGAIVGTTTQTSYVDHPRGGRVVRYRVFAVDTSANRTASDPTSEYVPGSTPGGVGSVHRIRHRRHRTRHGWVWADRFAARGAARMLARIDGHVVRYRRGSRISVSVRIPFGARHPRTLRVVARRGAARSSATWTYGR